MQILFYLKKRIIITRKVDMGYEGCEIFTDLGISNYAIYDFTSSGRCSSGIQVDHGYVYQCTLSTF